MAEIIEAINTFKDQLGSVNLGMIGIYGALVALALLGLLFSRMGK